MGQSLEDPYAMARGGEGICTSNPTNAWVVGEMGVNQSAMGRGKRWVPAPTMRKFKESWAWRWAVELVWFFDGRKAI